MPKPTLCLDFDGVIHSYVTPNSPWDPAYIPDPPVPGTFEFIRAAQEHFAVAVYSSRSNQPGGLKAMQRWFIEHGGDRVWLDELQWSLAKPSAFLTIDDRAITFMGTWPDPSELLKFRPWNKKLGPPTR